MTDSPMSRLTRQMDLNGMSGQPAMKPTCEEGGGGRKGFWTVKNQSWPGWVSAEGSSCLMGEPVSHGIEVQCGPSHSGGLTLYPLFVMTSVYPPHFQHLVIFETVAAL